MPLTRRALLASALAAPALARAASAPEPEESASALAQALRQGQLTARALVERYQARIRALDPQLHAVLELDPDALAQAEALGAERKQKGPRGPLHGLPVLLKDNIATAGRTRTTAGSLALEGARVPREAHLAKRLREAGCVLLGKANLSEWANFRSGFASSGWSGRGGQCRNPYALDRSPSGSSSGTAAALAANLCALGVGTETDGSITSPAAACGLVGLKPTLGLVSRAGIVPIAHSQDTAGPMCRSVADAALLLSALAGPDPRDPATAPAAQHGADYAQALDPAGLKGARLGVVRARFFGASPHADALAEQALAALKAQGAVLVDPVDIGDTTRLGPPELEVLLYEFKADLNAYLAELSGEAPRTLAELIAWNAKHRDRELPHFGQDLFEQAQAKGPLTDAAYKEARAKCLELAKGGLDAALAQHKLDALVMPTQGPAWLIDLVNGDPQVVAATTAPAVAGYPHLTVPMGLARGLPVGLSFVGRPWSEALLLRLGFAFEQATRARRPPTLAASAG